MGLERRRGVLTERVRFTDSGAFHGLSACVSQSGATGVCVSWTERVRFTDGHCGLHGPLDAPPGRGAHRRAQCRILPHRPGQLTKPPFRVKDRSPLRG
eukprot:2536110-Rhodomonas_salina.1